MIRATQRRIIVAIWGNTPISWLKSSESFLHSIFSPIVNFATDSFKAMLNDPLGTFEGAFWKIWDGIKDNPYNVLTAILGIVTFGYFYKRGTFKDCSAGNVQLAVNTPVGGAHFGFHLGTRKDPLIEAVSSNGTAIVTAMINMKKEIAELKARLPAPDSTGGSQQLSASSSKPNH